MHHRRGLRRLLGDRELANQIAADPLRAGVDERRRALIRYVAKLTRTPSAMTEEDVQSLRAAGFSDPDILHIVEVAAYYGYVNRIADGLGVELESGTPES